MEPEVQVTALQGNANLAIPGMGMTVQQLLLGNNFNVNALRTEAVLRKDEWVHYDSAVINVARQRLVGIADLIENNLTYNVPNALGVTSVEYEKASDIADASISMSGVTDGGNTRMAFDIDSVPLPIIHRDFQVNIRALEASRRNGTRLDTTQASVAARKVSEKVEQMLFAGAAQINIGGKKIYGYTTAPSRNTGSVTASWASATGEQIVTDVNRMIDAAAGDNMYGPFALYLPVSVFNRLGNDYKANSDKTILQRIKEISGIQIVKPSYNLSGTNIMLVQLSADTVDLIDGLQPTIVQWDSHGGMVVNFKVMAIMAPRIRSDYEDRSGLVHFS